MVRWSCPQVRASGIFSLDGRSRTRRPCYLFVRLTGEVERHRQVSPGQRVKGLPSWARRARRPSPSVKVSPSFDKPFQGGLQLGNIF